MDKSQQKIAAMFDDIAPKYDFLNHLLTLNIDKRWRKQIVKRINDENIIHDVILDLASGTGDLTLELAKLNCDKIYSADISEKMLELQRKKISDTRVEVINASASALPFENSSIDIVTIGFGVRNFENLTECLKEIKRVLKPNGQLVILEMFKSKTLTAKLFNVYFSHMLPFIGNLISRSKAYSYLQKSVNDFHSVDSFTQLAAQEGFALLYRKNNFAGVVNTLWLGKV